jgi:hypothetical protein
MKIVAESEEHLRPPDSTAGYGRLMRRMQPRFTPQVISIDEGSELPPTGKTGRVASLIKTGFTKVEDLPSCIQELLGHFQGERGRRVQHSRECNLEAPGLGICYCAQDGCNASPQEVALRMGEQNHFNTTLLNRVHAPTLSGTM